MNPIQIRGVKIYPFTDMQHLICYAANKKKMFLSINAEIIMKSDDRVADIINRNIGYADGFGAVKALKQKEKKLISRIPGCELWLKFIELYYDKMSFYLIGSTEETIQATIDKLIQLYPKINIVGFRNGYIRTKEEKDVLIKDIKKNKPNFVFVAMGFPIQEYLMDELYTIHPAIYLNLGGSFDVFVGKVSRAPYWIQKIGFEWFYRFMTHPSRYKRQIVYIQFLFAYCFRKL